MRQLEGHEGASDLMRVRTSLGEVTSWGWRCSCGAQRVGFDEREQAETDWLWHHHYRLLIGEGNPQLN
jgi:hypothetical protein